MLEKEKKRKINNVEPEGRSRGAKKPKNSAAETDNVSNLQHTEDTEIFVFQDNGNFMELEVSKQVQQEEFPLPSDDDEEDSDAEEGELIEQSQNNNVTRSIQNEGGSYEWLLGTQRSLGVSAQRTETIERPTFLDNGPSTLGEGTKETGCDSGVQITLSMMQDFTVKRGIINETMSPDELQNF